MAEPSRIFEKPLPGFSCAPQPIPPLVVSPVFLGPHILPINLTVKHLVSYVLDASRYIRRVEGASWGTCVGERAIAGDDVASKRQQRAAVIAIEQPICELVSRFDAVMFLCSDMEQERIGPSLVALFGDRVFGVQPLLLKCFDDRLPACHRNHLARPHKLSALLPALPKPPKLAGPFLVDQKVHHFLQFRKRKVAGVPDGCTLPLEIDRREYGAVNPRVFHGGTASQLRVEN